MQLFGKLYDMTLRWAAHPKAPWYLGGLSFAESSFFPIPPDVMLAPMVLAKRNKAWWFATITTIASVLGGIAGYLIGWLAFDVIEPWVMQAGYGDKLELSKQWFAQWGVWVVFIAGFAPIPYKLFTISAGVLAMSFLPFVIASLIGRGARFFLVAG
ncbi:MAG: DedA family protein, partial [Thiotrichales bacterium]|nr:DedA family protein [Thiotrichales bacterium]